MQASNSNHIDNKDSHTKRRARLLGKYPTIKNLMGYDVKQAIPVLIIVPLQIGLARYFSMVHHADNGCVGYWIILFLFIYLVGAILTHWLAMAIHETSHQLVFKHEWQNRCLALLANVPIVIPFAMSFHKYHNHSVEEQECVDADLSESIAVSMTGTMRFKKILWWLLSPFFYLLRALLKATKPNRWEVLNIVLMGMTTALIALYVGWVGILYLLLCAYVGMGPHPIAAHFIRGNSLLGQEDFSYYGPLNEVSYNIGYRNEHHDFMNVPSSRLPRLKVLLSEEYEPLTSHTSWTKVLLDCISEKDRSRLSKTTPTNIGFLEDKRAYLQQWTYCDFYL